MPLVFVTGISTSGKSAVAKELSKRGYKAYDTEQHGISAWYNRQTGERVAELGEMPERNEEWLNQHEWLISTDWLKSVAKNAQSELIFVCGGGANEEEVRKLSDKVIWLKTDETTIRKRLQNRRDHDYGTRPHELKRIVSGNRRGEIEYRELSAEIVDATQPLEKVVADILSII